MHAARLMTAAAMMFAFSNHASAAGLQDAPPGALSCSGCHPTGPSTGTEVQRLAGRKPDDIVAAMQAYRSGQRTSVTMERIAKGFSEDEVKAIASWYSAQKD